MLAQMPRQILHWCHNRAKCSTGGDCPSTPTACMFLASESSDLDSKLCITFASRSICVGSRLSAFPTSRAALLPR